MKSKITKIQEILTKGIAIALVGMFSFTPIAFAASSLDDSGLNVSIIDQLLYGKVGATVKEIEKHFIKHDTLYISTEEQLRALAEYVNSSHTTTATSVEGCNGDHSCKGKTIILTKNINVSKEDWNPIGKASTSSLNIPQSVIIDISANTTMKVLSQGKAMLSATITSNTNTIISYSWDGGDTWNNTAELKEDQINNIEVEHEVDEPGDYFLYAKAIDENGNSLSRTKAIKFVVINENTSSSDESYENEVGPGKENEDIIISDSDYDEILDEIISSTEEEIRVDTAFEGTFNGNGYTISGVTYSKEKKTYTDLKCIGLFGATGESASIKNLLVDDFNIDILWEERDLFRKENDSTAYSYYNTTGNIVGYNKGEIENCTNKSNIYGAMYVGGIVGYNDRGIIKNCTNKGKVRGLRVVGGITGYELGGTITGCTNNGLVYARESFAGGILGYGRNNVSISNVYNNGEIHVDTSLPSEDIVNINGEKTIFPHNHVGGIAGSIVINEKDSINEIKNCINEGKVTGYLNVGGITGSLKGTNIEQAINKGKISATGDYSGGIVGCSTVDNVYQEKNNEIKYVSNIQDINGDRYVGGIAGYANSTNISYSINYAENPIFGTEGYVGGIAGVLKDNSNISYVLNYGRIFGKYNIGGIVGGTYSSIIEHAYNQDSSSTTLNIDIATADVLGNYNVGGIAGADINSKIENVGNTGEVLGTLWNVGGIVGYCQDAIHIKNAASLTSARIDVDHWKFTSTSEGSYSNTTNPVNKTLSATTVPSGVGGIVGYAKNTNEASSNFSITNCYVFGNPIGMRRVGGVVGYIYNDSTKNISVSNINKDSKLSEIIGKVIVEEQTARATLKLDGNELTYINESICNQYGLKQIGKICGYSTKSTNATGKIVVASSFAAEENYANGEKIIYGVKYNGPKDFMYYNIEDSCMNDIKKIGNNEQAYVNFNTYSVENKNETCKTYTLGSKLTSAGYSIDNSILTTVENGGNLKYTLTKIRNEKEENINLETYLKAGDTLKIAVDIDKVWVNESGNALESETTAPKLQIGNLAPITATSIKYGTSSTSIANSTSTTFIYEYTVKDGDNIATNKITLLKQSDIYIAGTNLQVSFETIDGIDSIDSIDIPTVIFDTIRPTISSEIYVEDALKSGRYKEGKEVLITATTSERIYGQYTNPVVRVRFSESGIGKYNYIESSSQNLGIAKLKEVSTGVDGLTKWTYSYQIQQGDEGRFLIEFVGGVILDKAENSTSIKKECNIVEPKYEEKKEFRTVEIDSINFYTDTDCKNEIKADTAQTGDIYVKVNLNKALYSSINTPINKETAPSLKLNGNIETSCESVDYGKTIKYKYKKSTENPLTHIKYITLVNKEEILYDQGQNVGNADPIERGNEYTEELGKNKFYLDSKNVMSGLIADNIYADTTFPAVKIVAYKVDEIPEDTEITVVQGNEIENSITNAKYIRYRISFNEDVTGFDKEDIIVNNGTAKGTLKKIRGKNAYDLYVEHNVATGNEGDLQVIVEQNTVQDLVGHGNIRAENVIKVDKKAPTLTSYNVKKSDDGRNLIVETIFDEAIGTASQNDIEVKFGENAANGTVENDVVISENDKRIVTYTYNISGADEGTPTITLKEKTVQDIAKNANSIAYTLENKDIVLEKYAIKEGETEYTFKKNDTAITNFANPTYFKAEDKLEMNKTEYTIPNENVKTNENGQITSIDGINVEKANLYIDMKAPTISTEVYANEPNEKKIYSKDEIINIKVVASEKVQEPESTIPQLKISFSQSGLGKYNYQGENATTGNAKIDNVTEEEGKTVWNYIYKIADGDEGTINVKYLDTTIKDLAGNEQNIKNINMPEANSGNDITSSVNKNGAEITYSIFKENKENTENTEITDFSSVTTFAKDDIIKIVVNYPDKLYTSWGSSNVYLGNDNSPKLALYNGNTKIVEEVKGEVSEDHQKIIYSYEVEEKEQLTQITKLVQTYGTKVYIGQTTTAYSAASVQQLSLENHNLYINTLDTAINTNGIKADTVDPTVKITHKRVRDENGKVKENEYKYTFKWSEEVVGFTVDSITAKNGVKGDLSEVTKKDDGTYSYTINISKANSSKDITIIVERGVCKDLAGHKNIRAEYDTANMNLNRIELDNGDYYTFAKITTDEQGNEKVEEIKSFETPNYFISGDVIRVIKNGEIYYDYTVEQSVDAKQQLTITIDDSNNSVEYKNNTEGKINIAEANIYFDTIAPTISTIAYAENRRDKNYYTSGEKIIIEATASEELKNTEAPDLYVKFGEGNEQLAQKDSTIVEENNATKWYYSYIIKSGDNGKISIFYDEQAVIEDLAGNTTKLDIYSQTSEGQSTQGVTATIAGHKMSNNQSENINITYKITNSKTYITEGNLEVEVNIPYFIYTGYMNGIENGVNKNYANLLTDTGNAPKLYVECGGKYYSNEGYTATSISHNKNDVISGKQQLQCEDVITTLTYQIPITDFNCSGVTQLTKMKISIPNDIYMSQRYIKTFAADENGTNDLYDVSKFKEITYGVSSSQNVGECDITGLEKYIDKNKISEKFDIGDIYADTIEPSIEIKAEKINDDNEITPINNDITNASRIKYTFTASEEVTFNKNAIKLQNGTISEDLEGPTTQEDGRYEYTMIVSTNVANGNIGNVILELQQGAFTDRAGNISSEDKKETCIDKKAPSLQKVQAYKEDNSVKIEAIFDEAIKEENLPELKLQFDESGDAEGKVTPSIEENKIVYTYEPSEKDLGILSIKSLSGTVYDLVGNSTKITKPSLVDGEEIVIDKVPAELVKITVKKPEFDYETLNNGDAERYGLGKTITVKAEFNENIENTNEAPKLKFQFGTADEADEADEKEIGVAINNNIITYTYAIENEDNGEFIITGLEGTVIDRAGNETTNVSIKDKVYYEDGKTTYDNKIIADTTAQVANLVVVATDANGKTNLGIKPQGNNYKAGTKLTITATIDEYVYKKDDGTLSKFTKDTAPELNVKFGEATTSNKATCKEVTYEDNKTKITYEYVIINEQNGNMQLNIAQSQYYDIALNANSVIEDTNTNTTVIADTVKLGDPTIEDISTVADARNNQVRYSVTFNSENILYYINSNNVVTSLNKDNAPKLITNTSGEDGITADSINGNKIVYIERETIICDSNATLEDSQLCDAAGNFYKGGNDQDIPGQPVEPDVDTVAPYIEEIKAYTNYGTDQQKEVTGKTTKETIITYEIKWSEPVENFDKDDITVFNGNIQSFRKDNGDTKKYIVTVYSPIEGKCPILIPEGICTDVAENANEQRVTYNQVVIDYTKPEVRAKVNGGNYVIDTDKKKSTLKETIVVNEEVSKFEYIWSKSTELPTEDFITINPDEIQINSDIKLEKQVEETGTYYLYMKVTDLAENTFVGRTSGFVVNNSNITLTPSTDEPTNQDVTVTVTYGVGLTENRKAGIQGKTQSADSTMVIASENGTVYAESTDIAGNKVCNVLKIENIDKIAPEGTITYVTNEDKSVTATISFNEDNVTITNNNGESNYVFEENGEFTFEFRDVVGNTNTAKAAVTSIDKTSPEATIEYTTNGDGSVTAKISFNEEAVITNNNGKNTYVFTKNGEFTFEFKDLAGNTGTAVAKVTTIKEQDEPVSPPVEEDKTAPEITFNYTTTTSTVGTIIGATITTNEDAIISYSWDNKTWISTEDYVRNVNVKKNPTTAGTYTLYAKAIDKVGNKSKVSSIKFTVINSETEIKRPEVIFNGLTTIQKDGVKYVKVTPTFTTDELTSKMDKDALLGYKVSYNKLTSDNKLKTGSEIIVNGTTKYTVIVNGDVNCDGKVDFLNDIVMINNYRIGINKNLSDIQILAGDINNSGTIDFIPDIVAMNNYRLGRIKVL